MKTILIAHNYSEDSFAFMSHHLANYLANNGHKVIFISHKPFFLEPFEEPVNKGELRVYSWPTEKRPTKLSDALWFVKVYLKYKPSVVISHFVNVNITISVSKLLSFWKVKAYPYYHTLSTQILQDSQMSFFRREFTRSRKFLLYKLFSNSIICPSDFAKEDLKSYYFMKNGIKVLNPMKDRFQGKKELSGNEIIISFLGRIDLSKGVLTMVEAFNNYYENNPATRIRIKIAGGGSQVAVLKDLIGRNEKINYVGSLEYRAIDQYLNESHFLMIPSLHDNLPTVGLEALMNQTPLLISHSTGLTNELTDGVDCFKFYPEIQDIINVFSKVENSFENQIEMGENARKTFLDKFGIEAYCQKIEKLIEK